MKFLMGVLTVSLAIFLSGTTAGAISISEQVELTVADTRLTINGYAAPNSIIRFEESSSVIATTTSNSSGFFTKTLNSQPAGIRNMRVYFLDSNNLGSSKINLSTSLQSQTETVVNVLLAPTITFGSQSKVSAGSTISIRGYTLPNKKVNISVDFGALLFSTKSDNLGYYEYLLDTSLVTTGDHVINTRVLNGGDMSISSEQLKFNVKNKNTPNPDIVVSPSLLTPPITNSPKDGALIDGDRVTIYGEAQPGTQINVYENGVIIGSVITDDSGSWSFLYKAKSTPVTLNFEACRGGECSVQSKSITLNFKSLNSVCFQDFELEAYRFWDIEVGQEFSLALKNENKGKLLIDWGDGTTESFSQDTHSAKKFEKTYAKHGVYSGTIELSYDNCVEIKYFSVNVKKSEEQNRVLILLILSFAIAAGSYLVGRDKIDKS